MNQKQQALLPILTDLYNKIYDIESLWGIHFREGDNRTRIDYFHDAARALGSEEKSRLSLEYLSYDLAQLRIIKSKPLKRGTYIKAKSVRNELIKSDNVNMRPPSAVKRELAELYKDYTVIFAAIFAENADNDFKSRKDEMETAKDDLVIIEDIVNKISHGEISANGASEMLDDLEIDELADKIRLVIETNQEEYKIENYLEGIKEQVKKKQLKEKKIKSF